MSDVGFRSRSYRALGVLQHSMSVFLLMRDDFRLRSPNGRFNDVGCCIIISTTST